MQAQEAREMHCTGLWGWPLVDIQHYLHIRLIKIYNVDSTSFLQPISSDANQLKQTKFDMDGSFL